MNELVDIFFCLLIELLWIFPVKYGRHDDSCDLY